MRRLKAYRQRNHDRKITKIKLAYFLLIPVLVVLLGVVFIFIKINQIEKIVYLDSGDGGFTNLNVLDLKMSRHVVIKVDNSIEVETAKNFGKYTLGNTWILARKEGVVDELITQTIVKNFYLPVYKYIDRQGQSNLNIYEKIIVTAYEKGLILTEELEYQVKSAGKPSNVITVNFFDSNLADNLKTLEFVDLSGDLTTANSFSEIIDSLGLKISMYEKGYDQNFDCLIETRLPSAVSLVETSKALRCEFRKDDSLDVDVRVTAGGKFSERF